MLPGISFFGGGIPVNPGSQTFSSAGTYLFTVPAFNTLTVEVWGAGGAGGGSSYGNYSPNGGSSSFFTASAAGGGGGQGALTSNYGNVPWGAGGAGGSPAVGNVTQTNGNAGYAGDSASRAVGAGAPNGGGNVTPVAQLNPDTAGSSPGGGGAGWWYSTGGKFPAVAGGGGSGAYAKSIYTPSLLVPNTVLTVIVGAGGVDPGNYGGPGAAGKIIVTWA